ncbi:hypothetical protein FHETE_6324 [Fusarium heterosporum]|uniref:Myb-like domain-containing protein n=1 Tax=Fusarium heterosporum TaxID=42747 RepID=A0A8H5TCQ7_FUSHE|nr:hypothetical protein FHETE_6324 [Fusarium heterosporum]
MSDTAPPKTNAWTEEAKNELLLRIIAQLKPEGKSINWSEIHMEGRTIKSLQNQWTFFNKRMEAYKNNSADGITPATPVKKTPARKRTPKLKKAADCEDDDEFASPKNVTPRKRRAPKTEDTENVAKAVKMELSDAFIKDESEAAEEEV